MQKNGEEQVITVKGVQYKLGKLTIPLLQEFFAWTKSVLPNAYEEIASFVKSFPVEIASKMVEEARKRMAHRGTINDPEGAALMSTKEGLTKLFHLLFRKYQPHLTADQVSQILEDAHDEHGLAVLDGIITKAAGEVEKKEKDVEDQYLAEIGKLPPVEAEKKKG